MCAHLLAATPEASDRAGREESHSTGASGETHPFRMAVGLLLQALFGCVGVCVNLCPFWCVKAHTHKQLCVWLFCS